LKAIASGTAYRALDLLIRRHLQLTDLDGSVFNRLRLLMNETSLSHRSVSRGTAKKDRPLFDSFMQ